MARLTLQRVTVPADGQVVTIADYLSRLPLPELKAKLAETTARIEAIERQLERDVLTERKGPTWRRQARRAMHLSRLEAAAIRHEVSRIEHGKQIAAATAAKNRRFEAHISGVPNSQMVALERTKEAIERLNERDARLHALRDTKTMFFAKAANELLPKRTLDELWQAARAIDPEHECWLPTSPLSTNDRAAINRAKKLRAEHERDAGQPERKAPPA